MESNDTSSGEKSQSSVSPDFVSHGNEMFVALADPRTEVPDIVNNFLSEIYSQDKEIGEYTLIEFVFRCGGYRCKITKKLTKYGYADLVEYVTKKYHGGDYTLHPLLGKKSKLNANKLSDFISELVNQSSDSLVAYDEYLLPNLAEFLRSAAQTGYNNLRYTATFFSMRLTTALFIIETNNQKLRDRSAEDLQDVQNSRQASHAILMHEKATKKKKLYEKRLQNIKKITKYLLKKNFLNAYRDMWQPVQLLSIQELVIFVHTAPAYMNTLGKYIIQAMVDPAVAIRITALKAISTGLDAIDEDDDSEYEGFFEAALNGLIDRVIDVNETVAVLAIQLIGKIRERFPSIDQSPEDKCALANMVYATRQKVAQEAGLVMRNQQRALKGSDFILWLARFHAKNVREFPMLFRPGTEALLLASLPDGCLELTDWEAMMAATGKAGSASVALARVINAAVLRTVVADDLERGDLPIVNKGLQKMTEVFLKPFVSLIDSCKDVETIGVYLKIVRHMDVETLCKPEYKAVTASLMKRVARVALVNASQFVLAAPCAGALAPLVGAGNTDAKDAVGIVTRFAITRLEEHKNDSSELALTAVEESLCLLAGFGSVMPVPIEIENQFLEILTEVADDASLSPSKWSPITHAYAIKALFYDYTWGLGDHKSSSTLEEKSRKKPNYIFTAILGFFESKQEFGEATKTVISAAIDLLCMLDQISSLDNFSELFLKVSKYLEINVFVMKDDSNVQLEYRPMVVSFFKLLIRRHIDPALSAVFYKNYALMSTIMQLTTKELHQFFCESMLHHEPLYSAVLAGFKKAYVDQYPPGSDSDLELSVAVTELTNTSTLVCSWLMPGKKTTKKDYEKKSEEIAKIMTEMITSCIASSATMAPFCEVLAPFADKLTDGHKRKMLKMVIKGFAGMSSPGVKKLVSRLKMKNTELEKLNGKPGVKDSEEVPPSPIEHLRLDGSRYSPLPLRSYSPLPLRSSKVLSSESRPALPSLAEVSETGQDHSRSESTPKIQVSPSKSSDRSDPVVLLSESSDPVLSPAENSGSIVEIQSSPDLEPRHRRKPLGHSTMIEKEPTDKRVGKPNPSGSSNLPKSVPGSTPSKVQAVALKNSSRNAKSHPRRLSFVPLPIGTSRVGESGRKKINIYPTLQENDDSIHEHPACSLAKNSSPAMVISAEDSSVTSDVCESNNGLGSGKPEISSSDESCNGSRLCDSVLDQSVSSARVTPPKTSSHQTCDAINRSEDMNVSCENAPTQKRTLGPRTPSQALNTSTGILGGWSVTANAGSFDKNGARSSSVPPSKGGSGVESNSSQESGILANTQLSKVNNSLKELELSPSSRQKSGSSEEALGKKQKAVENLLASEDCEEGLQRSSQPHLEKSSDPLKRIKGVATIPDECHSDNYDSEDFIPSSQLCSNSPNMNSPQENTFNQDALISEDESDYDAYEQETQQNSRDANMLASSLKEVVSSSPTIDGMGGESPDHNSDYSAMNKQQTSPNSSVTKKLASSPEATAASSPEMGARADMVTEVNSSFEEDPATLHNEQAIENSGDANVLANSPEEAVITFSPEIVGKGGMVPESDSDGEDEILSNRPYSASESECDLDSSESEMPDSGQKALERLAETPQETFRGVSRSLYRDCKESQDQASSKSENGASPDSEDQASSDREDQAGTEMVPSSYEMGSLPKLMMDLIKGTSSLKPMESGSLVTRSEKYVLPTAPSSIICPSGSLMSDSDSDGSAQSQASVAPSSVMSLPNSLINDKESDDSAQSQTSVAPSSVMSLPNSLIKDKESDGSVQSQTSVAPSSVMSSPKSLIDDKESDESVKLQVSVAPSTVTSPTSLLDDEESDGSVQSQTSVAPSSVVSPPNSLTDDKESYASVKSQTSAAPSSVVSSPNSVIDDEESDASVKSQTSVAPSSVMSSPNSVIDDEESDASVKSQTSAAPSSVMSSPNSVIDDEENDTSVKSQSSAAPSSGMSSPNSVIDDEESDASVKSQTSVAPSSVVSSPNSLTDDKESDASVKSQTSAAPSSVVSSPKSLIDDKESDASVKSQVSVAPSSVMSPLSSLMNYVSSDEPAKPAAPSLVMSSPNSLMNDINSDESVKSLAPSSAMSPTNSLMSDIESDESAKSLAPSSVMSPTNSLMNDIESDESVKSLAPSSVMSPTNSLMNDIESDESAKSLAPSSVMSPANSLMNDIESDESAKSLAPSSVMSPANSLMNDIESDESVKSLAPSSVMSPTNSLMSDIESDESAKSLAPSSVMSPTNSLMNDIDSDESAKSLAPSSVMSPTNSLMSDINSDDFVKSLVSVAPSCVSNPPDSLMGDIEDEGSVLSQFSVGPSVAASPPDSLMSDIE